MSFNCWDPWVDKTESAKAHPLMPEGLLRFMANDLYSVQFYEQETELGIITHLMVGSLHGKPIREWSHMQRIKNELVGPERLAIEIYPPKSELVDGANAYHIWVLPEGFKFPFGLPQWCHTQRLMKMERIINVFNA